MAGRIPRDFLDHLLSRLDIVELIDTRVPLKKTGRNFNACCPFHNEKTPSFTVSPDKQFYHCFGCSAHGNAIDFLMEYERLEFRDAVEELAHLAGLELPKQAAATGDSGRGTELLTLVNRADRFFRRQLREHPQRQRAIDYLRGRGLDGTTVRDFGIGYAPPGWDNLLRDLTGDAVRTADLVDAGLAITRDSGGAYDRFRDRIMFPIRDRRGRTIAFGGRALDDATPKYLNSPETSLFHKGRELYGLFEARRSNRHLDRLLIVEGYMDVIALAQHGIDYAVATLGTSTTAEHLERLFRITADLVFCFDGDQAGRDAAWRALEQTLPLLRDGHRVGYLFLPEGEDPDSLVRRDGAAAFEARLAHATPLADYFFEQLAAQVDLDSVDGRARLAELARPLLNSMSDSTFRDLLRQQIEKHLQIPLHLLDNHTRAGQPLSGKQTRRTLPRRAISLLLAQPQLALRIDAPRQLRELPTPGIDLLAELIDLVRNNPHITTAMILEQYRDNVLGPVLSKLAQADLELEPTLYEQEFLDVMAILKRLHFDQLRYLYDKAAQGHLSREEQELLRRTAGKPRSETGDIDT